MTKMTLIAALLSFASVGHAASEEAIRQFTMTTTANEVQMMDNATPAELATMFKIPATTEVPMGTHAEVQIDVSIASQLLTIYYPQGQFSLSVSTARRGYHTHTGCFQNPHLEAMHYSKKYQNSPMPHSMFYYEGFAVHGTMEEKELGHPASHGCVRVSRADATRLFNIVKQYGSENAIICVHD